MTLLLLLACGEEDTGIELLDTGDTGDTAYVSGNTPPQIGAVTVTPTQAYANSSLVCKATATDADGDSLTFAYRWSVGGTDVGMGDTLSSGFSKGDQVVCTVTVSDGLDTVTRPSAEVLILDSAPTVSASISPYPATAKDTLTCVGNAQDIDGDAITLSYAWSIGGTPVASTQTLAPSHFQAGDTVTCTVTADSGLTATATTSVTIGSSNTAPVVDIVDLQPVDAFEDVPLWCEAAGTDADGDAVTMAFGWTVNGSAIPVTGQELTGTHYDKHDDVVCVATPNDGTVDGASKNSNTVTIRNAEPGVGLPTISPTSPSANDDLTCVPGATSDADGDTVTLTYSWEVNGVAVSVTSATLDSSYTATRDDVECFVTAYDGEDYAPPHGSYPVTIN